MRKDPTQFRQRFQRWKNGEQVYNNGIPTEMDPVVITPDSQYNSFLNTLPLNQRLTPESEYSTHRYWELNNKPSDFDEAKNKGMYSLEDDGLYHSHSVQLTNTGDYEWMKPKHHSTAHMELDWYNSKEGADFKKQYELIDDKNRPGFYKYEKRVKLPKYNGGKEPNDDDVAVRDATYVDKTKDFAHTGGYSEYDQAKLDDANNEIIKQWGNTVYGALRFIPYIRYATDVADTFGLSPDQNGEFDTTDSMGAGGHLFSFGMNQFADELEKQTGNIQVRIGRNPRNRHYYTRTPAMAQEQAKLYRAFGKYNPLKFAGVVGDIYQEGKHLYNLHNAYNTYDSLRQTLPLYPPQFGPTGEPLLNITPNIDAGVQWIITDPTKAKAYRKRNRTK